MPCRGSRERRPVARKPDPERSREAFARKPAVRRPGRRQRIVGCRDRNAARPATPALLKPREDRLGKAVPGRPVAAGEMVRAERAVRGDKRRKHLRDRRREIVRRGGAAVLVGDDADIAALFRPPQHQAEEIRPRSAVDPGRAQDEMPRIGGADRGLAGELRAAVGVERADRVVLLVEPVLRAVEHIVGGEIDDGSGELAAARAIAPGPAALTACAVFSSLSASSTSV